MLFQRLSWRFVTLAVSSVFGLWILGGVLAEYEIRQTQQRAEKFLAEFSTIQVGKSEGAEVEALIGKYHGKRRANKTMGPGSPCGNGASVVEFVFNNRILHTLYFFSSTGFSGVIYVKDNIVCFRLLDLFTAADGGYGVSVSEFREPVMPSAFSTRLSPAKTIVIMDIRAPIAAKNAAYSLNLSCIARFRGCRPTREMMPLIWQNLHEAAPGVLKTPWEN